MTQPAANRFAQAFSNASFLALARSYHLLVRGVFLYFLVALLGKAQYGLYGYAQSWYLILAPLAVLGGNELLINGFLRRPESERDDFTGTALSVRLVLGVPLTALLMIIALATETDPELRILIMIFAQALWLRVLISFYSSLFVARGRSRDWVFYSMLFSSVEALAIVWVAWRGSPLWFLALAQILVLGATLATAAWLSTRGYRRVAFRWQRPIAVSFFRDGAVLGAATWLLLAIPSALVIAYKPLGNNLQELGTLALVAQLLLILQQLIQRVSNALLPALDRPSKDSSGNLLVFAVWSTVLCVCTGGILCLVASPVAALLTAWLQNEAFGDALFLLADQAWIFIPMLEVQALRLAMIANGDAKGLLLATIAGAAGLVLGISYLAMGNALSPSGSLASAGVSFGLIAVFQLSRIITVTRIRHRS